MHPLDRSGKRNFPDMGLPETQEVCVTGGTGYIASSLVRKLLEKGYRVRTTVRHSEDTRRTEFLWNLPGARERLRIFEADLLQEGSFDCAVDGVHGVFHTACPVLFEPKDDPVTKLLDPCLKGSMNVLRACARSRSIRRVVMTSSCSAVRYDYNHSEDDLPLDESTWSNLEYCKQYQLWYPLAKTLAEQQAWEFAKIHEIDLVVVNPSFVVGPMLPPTPTSTILLVLHLLRGGAKTYPNQIIGFVHIDDVVTAHLLAYEEPSATGRYICSERVVHWADVIRMLKDKYPNYPLPSSPNVEEKGNVIPHTLSTSKIEKLGHPKFKTLEEMFSSAVDSFKQNGFLK